MMPGPVPPSNAVTPAAYVLVLDDDEGMRDLLLETLETDGFHVRCVASAQEALHLAEAADPRVILFDLTLGSMSGQAFVHAYRALPRASAALIVVSGATGLAHVADELQLAGYLTKPFDLDDLSRMIRTAFDSAG